MGLCSFLLNIEENEEKLIQISPFFVCFFNALDYYCSVVFVGWEEVKPSTLYYNIS